MPKLEIPNDFLCPITNDLMADPVTASDNKVYERSAIERIINEATSNPALSPITKQPLSSYLTPNGELKEKIQTFLKEYSVCSFIEFSKAVKTGKISQIVKLNYLETYVNQEDELGLSPLHYATQYGYLEMFDFLIAEGAVIASSSKNNISPLYIAVLFMHENMVSKLLSKGASPHLPNDEGVTPMQLAVSNPKLRQLLKQYAFPTNIILSENFYCPISKLLMMDPVKIADGTIFNRSSIQAHFINEISNPITNVLLENAILTPQTELKDQIQQAMQEHNIPSVDEYIDLIKAGNFKLLVTKKIPAIYLNLTCNGFTMPSYAAQDGHVEVLSMLLESGNNPNYLNNDNTTPLHFAAANRHFSCVKVLIKKGAKLIVKEGTSSPIHFAARHATSEMLKLLLTMDPGYSLDMPGNGNYTPLHYAAVTGNLNTLKFLLERKISKLAFDTRGLTALHLAALNGHISFLENYEMSIEDILKVKSATGKPFLVFLASHPKGAKFILQQLQNRKDTNLGELLDINNQDSFENYCADFFISLLNQTTSKDHQLVLTILEQNMAMISLKTLSRPMEPDSLFTGQSLLLQLCKTVVGIRILKDILIKEKIDLLNTEQLISLERALIKLPLNSNKGAALRHLVSTPEGCNLLYFIYVTNSVRFDPKILVTTFPSVLMLLCIQQFGRNFLGKIIDKYPSIRTAITPDDLSRIHVTSVYSDDKNLPPIDSNSTPFFNLTRDPEGRKILLELFEAQPNLTNQISSEVLLNKTFMDVQDSASAFLGLCLDDNGIKILKSIINAQNIILSKIAADFIFEKHTSAANQSVFLCLTSRQTGYELLAQILLGNRIILAFLAELLVQQPVPTEWLSGLARLSISIEGRTCFKLILKWLTSDHPKGEKEYYLRDFASIFDFNELTFLLQNLTEEDVLEIAEIHSGCNKKLLQKEVIIKKFSNQILISSFEKISLEESKEIFNTIYAVLREIPSRGPDFLRRISSGNPIFKKQLLKDWRLMNHLTDEEWVAFFDATPEELDAILLTEVFWSSKSANKRKLLLQFSAKSLSRIIKNDKAANLFLPEDFLLSPLFMDVEVKCAIASQQILLRRLNHKQFLLLALSHFDVARTLLNDYLNSERWTRDDFELLEQTFPHCIEFTTKLKSNMKEVKDDFAMSRQKTTDPEVSVYILGNRINIPADQLFPPQPRLQPNNFRINKDEKSSRYSWKEILGIISCVLLGVVGLGLIVTGVGALFGIGVFASMLTTVNFLGFSLGALGCLSLVGGVTSCSTATLAPYGYFSNKPGQSNIPATSSKEPEMFSPAWCNALLAESTLSPEERKNVYTLLTYQPPGVDFKPLFSKDAVKKSKKMDNKVDSLFPSDERTIYVKKRG